MRPSNAANPSVSTLSCQVAAPPSLPLTTPPSLPLATPPYHSLPPTPPASENIHRKIHLVETQAINIIEEDIYIIRHETSISRILGSFGNRQNCIVTLQDHPDKQGQGHEGPLPEESVETTMDPLETYGYGRDVWEGQPVASFVGPEGTQSDPPSCQQELAASQGGLSFPLPLHHGNLESLPYGDAGETANAVDIPDEFQLNQSPKKKPRITLARGHACVGCRQRKLKCQEGVRPCSNCAKAGVDCRDEELPKKKPKNVVLEERIGSSFSGYSASSTPPESINQDMFGEGASSSGLFTPYQRRSSSRSSSAMSSARQSDILPNSQLEQALIHFILPYTPHLLIPVHPQRFLSHLSLRPGDSSRPHPALLYVMFSQAVHHLEASTPAPSPPEPPFVFPPSTSPSFSVPEVNTGYILGQLRGTSSVLLEKARVELDRGIRQVDRPFDLVRAAIGIARVLYSEGRFVEGWLTPVANLLVACGLDRISEGCIQRVAELSSNLDVSQPFATAFRNHQGSMFDQTTGQPQLETRPVIIPPARDEIEEAERVMTYWAARRRL
ncbi:hypothetical protein L204_100577 [Cryptococcus depauperatus]